jgi:hypothetical protein
MCIHAGKYCFQLIKVCRMLTRTRRVTEIGKNKISGGGIVADVDRNYVWQTGWPWTCLGKSF